MVNRKVKLEPFRISLPDDLKDFVLEIPIEPKAKERGRIGHTKQNIAYIYKSPRDKEWGAKLRTLILEKYSRLAELDAKNGLTMINIIEKSTNVRTRWGEPIVAKPDLSNYIKNIEDELNNFAYTDDSGIYQIYSLKLYNDRDYLTIIIMPGMEYKSMLADIISNMSTTLAIIDNENYKH